MPQEIRQTSQRKNMEKAMRNAAKATKKGRRKGHFEPRERTSAPVIVPPMESSKSAAVPSAYPKPKRREDLGDSSTSWPATESSKSAADWFNQSWRKPLAGRPVNAVALGSDFWLRVQKEQGGFLSF